MYQDDTIAAISTAYAPGGIGIIRISGNNAFDIAEKIFKGNKKIKDQKSHTIVYGKIIDPERGNVLDEVLLTKMKKPNTFTKEYVIEINCHGGLVVLRSILHLVVSYGARPAEPGEFTKRAFLNGRIDLSQAEAVIDIINSKTEESSRTAVDQLEGKLSVMIRAARSKLIELIAHIEVTVDYPEHDIEEITGVEVYNGIKVIEDKLVRLAKGFDKGRILREGISAVIVGKPNVGKSSLLNTLSGKSKAIVTDIPGTTRDVIEEYINMGGIPVRLIDTAGIRETEDIVEKIGVEKAEKEVLNADLIMLVFDASTGLDDDDRNIYRKILSLNKKNRIIILNKVDISSASIISELELIFKDETVIKTSTLEELGVKQLEEEMESMFMSRESGLNNEVLVTNIRHKNLIDMALNSIRDAAKAYEDHMPLDFITIDIKNAAEYLGQITGESISEDVMHEIFSRFCIGK